MKFNIKQEKQHANLTDKQLASVLNKQSKEFCQQDDVLQKQIVSALERQSETLKSDKTKQPASRRKWLFQFQYTAVALIFVAVISSIVITNTNPIQKVQKPQIVQINSSVLKVENLDKIANKIESKSITKLSHESIALKQDLQKLIHMFSFDKKPTVSSDAKA